jgi:TRAP-type mannitol/chloroaromatic compound transport system permease small subunit
VRRRIPDALDGLAEWSGRALAWLTLAMVVVTFAVVVLRRGFGIGWIAVQEAVLWMHGIAFMLGLAYTLKHDAHVRVDVFYRRFGERGRAWVDLGCTLLFLAPLCLFILWSSWSYVVDAWAIRERSREAGGLPGLYLLKTVIPLAAVLLALQGRALVMRSLNVLFPKKERR